MKAKWLSFAFFYFHLFFGIGTFQRDTSKKIKKSSPAPHSRVRLCVKRLTRSGPSCMLAPAAAPDIRRNPRFRSAESIQRIPGLAKDLFAATRMLRRKINIANGLAASRWTAPG
jgi:hypothetical protein